MSSPEEKTNFFATIANLLDHFSKLSIHLGLGFGLAALIVDLASSRKEAEIPLVWGLAICFVSALFFGSLVNVCDGIVFLLRRAKRPAKICFLWALFVFMLTVISFFGALSLRERLQNWL